MTMTQNQGILTEFAQHLGVIFRHMLPGVLVVGATAAAYPEWFCRIDFKSWQHLIVLGVVTLAVGNTWFALNRFGFHQVVDFILYYWRSRSPAKHSTWKELTFLDDLGKYTYRSLHTGEESARARQHVALRASTVLLIWTAGELALLFAFFHSGTSVLEGNKCSMEVVGVLALLVGFWQMVITRRIDHYVVNPGDVD